MKRLAFPDLLHSGQSNVLAGAGGTHCICTIHQNVKLTLHMVQSHVPELTTYHGCLAKFMCNPPSPSYCLGECPVCPGTHLLKEELVALYLLGPGTAASMTLFTIQSKHFIYLALVLQHPWLFAPIQKQTLKQTSHKMLEHGAESDVGVTCPSRVLVRSRVLVSPAIVPSRPGF